MELMIKKQKIYSFRAATDNEEELKIHSCVRESKVKVG